MSSATNGIVWVQRLLTNFGIFLHTTTLHFTKKKKKTPTLLHADNISVIQIATNLVFNERTKHIEVDCQFIRNFFSTKEDYSSLHIVQSSTSGLIHQGAHKSET